MITNKKLRFQSFSTQSFTHKDKSNKQDEFLKMSCTTQQIDKKAVKKASQTQEKKRKEGNLVNEGDSMAEFALPDSSSPSLDQAMLMPLYLLNSHLLANGDAGIDSKASALIGAQHSVPQPKRKVQAASEVRSKLQRDTAGSKAQ